MDSAGSASTSNLVPHTVLGKLAADAVVEDGAAN